ncbi:MAG TPA: ACT domain-containing protein [Ideonella sp.]|nr:ACT domain-containing protein [Ideonella sp.]
MKTSLVLTAVGRDRPGLIRAIAQEVAAAGGDWLDSRMAALAGQFVGVVQVAVPADAADALAARLRALEAEGLRLTVEAGAHEASAAPAGRMLHIELLGHDRPGIVRDVSSLLAEHQVSVEELETGTESGAFSGESLFRARACLRVPPTLPTDVLRGLLQTLGNELMVDVNLEEDEPARR